MEKEIKQIDYLGNIRKNFLIRLTILSLIVLFFVIKGMSAKTGQVDSFFRILFFSVINGLIVIAIFIGIYYKKKRKDTYKSGEMKNRLEKYLFANRYLNSSIEAAVAFTAVGFVLTNNNILIYETVFFYIWLIYIFPSKKKILRETELDIDNI